MAESNKLRRRFLFDIVPEGEEKSQGLAGKSRDREAVGTADAFC